MSIDPTEVLHDQSRTNAIDCPDAPVVKVPLPGEPAPDHNDKTTLPMGNFYEA